MGFAKVQLMGNLGKDPEVFGFEGRNGRSEGVKFSIAVNRGKEDAKVTDWYDCLCFGQTAKTAKEWLQKGKTVISRLGRKGRQEGPFHRGHRGRHPVRAERHRQWSQRRRRQR